MSNSEYIYFLNGEQAGTVSAKDRGLTYGHGLFETVRLANGSLPLLRYHLSRLVSGAGRLGLIINLPLLQQYIDQLLLASPDNGIIKIIVTAGSEGRGYACDPPVNPSYILQWFPFVDYSSSHRQQGVALKYCEHRLPHSPVLAGVKHLNRLDQVMARAEWKDNFPEGLMRDYQGNVVEGVSSNLFIFRGGLWLTPCLNQCGVAGVMRQYLMDELLPGNCFQAKEENISVDQLISADEVFVCNSVIGIWPVISLEGRGSWLLGEKTLQIQKNLYEAFPCFG